MLSLHTRDTRDTRGPMECYLSGNFLYKCCFPLMRNEISAKFLSQGLQFAGRSEAIRAYRQFLSSSIQLTNPSTNQVFTRALTFRRRWRNSLLAMKTRFQSLFLQSTPPIFEKNWLKKQIGTPVFKVTFTTEVRIRKFLREVTFQKIKSHNTRVYF